jgi:hypothetical protein
MAESDFCLSMLGRDIKRGSKQHDLWLDVNPELGYKTFHGDFVMTTRLVYQESSLEV